MWAKFCVDHFNELRPTSRAPDLDPELQERCAMAKMNKSHDMHIFTVAPGPMMVHFGASNPEALKPTWRVNIGRLPQKDKKWKMKWTLGSYITVYGA